MLTEIHILNHIPPSKLDEYLSRGWFRMGQMIFTCHLLCFSNEVYSTVWVRLHLQGYQLKKSLRKLQKRNDRTFRSVIRRAIFDEERQRLYEAHKKRFEGYIPGSLRESLFGMEERNIYNTLEVAVYDEDQLIAISYFDIGHDSIASIMALYDPNYSRYSLGIYTMLKEIQYGVDQGKEYYYPGYVVPRYGKFDYKLRLGEMEYFNVPNKQWEPMETLQIENLPAETIGRKLGKIKAYLQEYNIPGKKITYPFYDKDLFGYEEEEFLQSPMLIDCSPQNYDEEILFIEYQYQRKRYRLCKGIRTFNSASIFLASFMEKFDPEKCCLDIILIDKIILEDADERVMVQKIRELL